MNEDCSSEIPQTHVQSVLIVSDDVLLRLGLEAALALVRIHDLRSISHAQIGTIRDSIDVLIVDPRTSTSIDHFNGIETLTELENNRTPSQISVALARSTMDSLVKLRLAEAGAQFVLPVDHVTCCVNHLIRRSLQPPEDLRLATRWALREAEGLAWDGDLAAFLRAAESFPSDVWLKTTPQSLLPLTRRQIMHLRRLAHDVGGLPAPDFRRYSTLERAAPRLPEWPTVRDFVRRLWGHTV